MNEAGGRSYWRRMLSTSEAGATAIGIGVIFSIISFRVDNLLIPPVGGGTEALGLYNVAYKLFEPSQILPGTLLAATFPLISQAALNATRNQGPEARSALRRLLAHNLSILFALA